jgi:hypothetical protein
MTITAPAGWAGPEQQGVRMKMTDMKRKGISRRTVLKGSAAAAGLAVGAGAVTGFPMVWAKTDITLRQFGTGVSNLNAIADKCKADLGITRGHPAGFLRYRRHRILDLQEGLSGRRHAADGRQED